jgi:hypothetical protein
MILLHDLQGCMDYAQQLKSLRYTLQCHTLAAKNEQKSSGIRTCACLLAGGGEVHGALCVCPGAVALHQLRTLDPAARRRRLLPAAGARVLPAQAAVPHLCCPVCISVGFTHKRINVSMLLAVELSFLWRWVLLIFQLRQGGHHSSPLSMHEASVMWRSCRRWAPESGL